MGAVFGVILIVTVWVGCLVGCACLALLAGLVMLRVGTRVGSVGFGKADRFISNVIDSSAMRAATSSVDTTLNDERDDGQSARTPPLADAKE